MTASNLTFHLLPEQVWSAQSGDEHYFPEAFEREGFIHCTDGEARVIETANRHCRDDDRPYVLISIDTDAVAAPIKYEDPNMVFPHIYGPLNTDAVVGVRRLIRDDTGTFLSIESD